MSSDVRFLDFLGRNAVVTLGKENGEFVPGEVACLGDGFAAFRGGT
jgi:hypothetical protein